MLWKSYIVVALGGAAGAVARYWLGGLAQDRLGGAFPYGTLVVNLSGSFVLGIFSTIALRLTLDESWRLLVAIGFLGAYTTFSTLTYETLQLIAEGARYQAAILNLLGTNIVGLLAAYAGIVAGRLLFAAAGRP